MSLLFQFHKILGVLRSRVVNSTLGLLLALPAARSLVFVITDGLSGVVVADALVATVEQFVVGHIVVLNVLLDLIEGPVGQGVDLDEASLIHLNDIEVTALATLATATASEDSMDVKLPVGTLGRLNLGNPVIELVVGLPETAAKLLGEFFFRVDAVGLVDVDVVVRIPLADTVDERKSFLEVVEGVEEDEVDHLRSWNFQLGEHVESHETSETKGSGLEEMGKRSNAPPQNICHHVS